MKRREVDLLLKALAELSKSYRRKRTWSLSEIAMAQTDAMRLFDKIDHASRNAGEVVSDDE